MNYKRVVTIQDISCVGQCSLTVALPVISVCGVEAAVLPSAVLSTHTAGFQGWTFRDLTEDMPAIAEHWNREGLTFDAIYTGYLGSKKQIDYVLDIFNTFGKEDCVKVVDPAMADNGKLYVGFDGEFVEQMKQLCGKADYVVPNLTEACFLTGIEYKEIYDEAYIERVIGALQGLGCPNVVLTGVSYAEGKTGVAVRKGSEDHYYCHDKLPNSCHGTGDIYAAAFVGALMRNKAAEDAARIAADFVLECIRESAKDPTHTYGARFEPVLYKLIESLN